MGATLTAGPGVERTVDEDFLALVYADPDLLRAAFDSIVQAQWPAEPPSHRGYACGRLPARTRSARACS